MSLPISLDAAGKGGAADALRAAAGSNENRAMAELMAQLAGDKFGKGLVEVDEQENKLNINLGYVCVCGGGGGVLGWGKGTWGGEDKWRY